MKLRLVTAAPLFTVLVAIAGGATWVSAGTDAASGAASATWADDSLQWLRSWWPAPASADAKTANPVGATNAL